MKLNESRKISAAFLACIFILMLICNTYTYYLSDDYAYMASYATGQRITSVSQIFPSMAAHAKTMNGRLVAHFFAQLFLMLPKWIFNIVNALVFTLQIVLVYKIGLFGRTENKPCNLILLAAFGGIWVYQPAFGQINLWLDGACNYLWGIAFGLVMFYPYVREFMTGKRIKNPVIQVLFVIFSLLAGAYSENGSAAFIFMSVLLLVLTAVLSKKRPAAYSILAIILAVAGFATMIFAPAELSKKAADFNLVSLLANFENCVEMLTTFGILFAVFAVLLVLAYFKKIEAKKVMLSSVVAAGAMAANFMMMFASYYAPRSAAYTVVLMVIADLVLMSAFFDGDYKPFVCCLAVLLVLTTSYNVISGVSDIYVTDTNMKAHVAHINECKENGITDVKLKVFTIKTKYSAAHGIKYLDMDTPYTWPNNYMASYYGVKSLIGVW